MLDETTKTKVATRLNRIEGQVAGVRRMVDDDAYCVDILNQIAAVQGALAKVGSIVLEHHLDTCVTEAFESGNDRDRRRKVEEIMNIFDRYGKHRTK